MNLGQTLLISAQVTIAGQTIRLEVARTPKQQAMGLMYRIALEDYRECCLNLSRPKLSGSG